MSDWSNKIENEALVKAIEDLKIRIDSWAEPSSTYDNAVKLLIQTTLQEIIGTPT